ncbi:hypothetical protein [Rhizobium leguminosarum]|uniref:hypothetical protein n=1 Tax=Rhizobium leguminosarum TaxID=384 RepID=UPI003F9B5721
MRFLQTILNAIMQLLMTPVQFLEWLLSKLSSTGGGAPAEPLQNLEAALPDEGRIDEARDLEKGKAAAADVILKQSPELQVKMFAGMSEADRLQADLSLLTPDQTFWLLDLSDDQLKSIFETSDRRIAAALNGEHNTLTAIRSVGQPAPADDAWLANRIEAKRAITFATAPSSSLGYAVH